MATHSSILAWRIPWNEEPGGLLCKVSQELDDVAIKWKHKDGRFALQCDVPVGSTAIVWVPFSAEQPKVKLSNNIRSLGVRDGYALYQVESGRYNFNSKL